MSPEEKKEIAKKRKVYIRTVRAWCCKMTDEEVREYIPNRDMSARGRAGKSKSPWRKFRLPGSPWKDDA